MKWLWWLGGGLGAWFLLSPKKAEAQDANGLLAIRFDAEPGVVGTDKNGQFLATLIGALNAGLNTSCPGAPKIVGPGSVFTLNALMAGSNSRTSVEIHWPAVFSNASTIEQDVRPVVLQCLTQFLSQYPVFHATNISAFGIRTA